ncbi:hypothetical protein [Nocardia nova]|uniref:hypothetical protein n=1 Tax=Nocardia nova TaxID=37330 RepID=UPI0033E85091
MPESVQSRRESGAVVLTVAEVAESTDLDTLVLEVPGGHLSWSLLAGHRIPAAVLFDPVAAQEWLWAVYGERVAATIAEQTDHLPALPAAPALSDLVDSARQLAYAHWADRWWPASTVDGIAALDRRLLDEQIAELTEVCDLLIEESDAPVAVSPLAPSTGRARDYALAAGATSTSGGLILATGTTGWDWRRCPPGLLDASEYAVSWQLDRESGANTVRVRAVAAPDLAAEPPPHLRPVAGIDTGVGTADLVLALTGDTWIGAAEVDSDDIAGVDIRVPGVGPADADAAGQDHGPRRRQLIRDFAANRLLDRHPAGIVPIPLLRAEIDAAASDSDF